MDAEKRARRQSFRVIVSEIIMFLTVVVTVIILALIVSGYWLNSDFKVERQGMLQVHSYPTGASVEVDNSSSWFQRTNTSKVLSSGEHLVSLTKEGYDTWSKTVKISEGLLYRLNYPRLFPLERAKDSVYDTQSVLYATVSPDFKYMLLVDNTTSWTLINLNSENLDSITIDVSKILPATSLAIDSPIGLFNGKVVSAEWDKMNEHILLKIQTDDSTEWIILNIRRNELSTNISRLFEVNLDNVRIFDNSANQLLATVNGNLHRIDVGARQISAILAKSVKNYNFYDSEIVYTTDEYAGIIKNGNESTMVQDLENSAQILIGKFYDQKYIFVVEGEKLTVYKRDDLSIIFEDEIGFTPEFAKVGKNGDFAIFNQANHFVTLDMEDMELKKWDSISDVYGWLDDYMIYSITNGEFYVYDFDGLNNRHLASNVSSYFPATITNDKWLYYFSDGRIIREWLIVK